MKTTDIVLHLTFSLFWLLLTLAILGLGIWVLIKGLWFSAMVCFFVVAIWIVFWIDDLIVILSNKSINKQNDK
jgi:hypothetical protein